MRRTIVLLATMALTLLVASGVALATAIGSAQAANKVVGPGESIQKAINAADPGDTIVVRGLHHEDVAIRKDGIKLRGDDAVIKPPAKADSPCAPEAICILGEMNFQTGEITGPRVSDVSVSGFTIRDFQEREQGDLTAFAIDVLHARDATVAGNRAIGNAAGIGLTSRSINTTIENNDVIGNPESRDGINVEISSNTTIAKNVVRNMPEDTNAIEVHDGVTNTTIEENDLVGNWFGVLIADATGTRIVSNDITDSTVLATGIVESTGTKILSNDISRSGESGIVIFGPERANNDAKVVGNNISGGPWGIWVGGAHHGSLAGNTIHDNCAGMFFEAFPGLPVGGFEVKANTVENNTRKCPAGIEDR